MKKNICLNMIVKNESRVIQRCLASVKEIIDYWIIADTGSTDGTQNLIRESLKGIPGELHEHPWVDFGHNRNEVLALSKAKGDYILFIDADEKLIFSDSFSMPNLDKDHYFIHVLQPDGSRYYRVFLINNSLDWKWKGVLHEEILSSEAKSVEIIKGVTNYSVAEEGHRTQDPKKFLKDAAVLEKALKNEPNNPRTVFYLALSYGNAFEFALALKYHEKRVTLGGDEEEIFFSLLCIANAQENLGYPSDTFIESYYKAYRYRPTRSEPLYGIAHYYNRIGNHLIAYLVSKFALAIPYPTDSIFVLHFIYDSGLLFQFADSASALGYTDEARDGYNKLLALNLTAEKKAEIEKTLSVLGSR